MGSILAVIGALAGALAVMYFGAALRNRSVTGLALTLWIVFGFGGAMVLPDLNAAAIRQLIAEGASANSLGLSGAILIPVATAAATMLVGLLFVLMMPRRPQA